MVMHRAGRGFTLIELLVVLAIIATLLSLVAPRYVHQTDRARAAVLKENLSGLRQALDQYNEDIGHYPAALSDLVDRRYLRRIPIDPITNRSDTWILITAKGDSAQASIRDIASGAPGTAQDGTPYRTW
jgi:type II secretion system protein G